MSKISELSDGGSLLPTDFLIAVRSGGNVKVQADQTEFDRIRLGDNEKIELGNSQDLQIYHTGTESWIKDAGTGNFYIDSNGAAIQLTANGAAENMLNAVPNGGITLYHNNAIKLATSSTGIDVTGVITTDGMTTSADINFGDNGKAIFGAGSDLQIHHNGSKSIIHDVGAGNLEILADDFVIKNSAGVNTLFYADAPSGAVSLYNSNAVKLATTSTGIDISGSATMDGLTVDGAVQINGANAGQLTLDATGQHTQILLEQNGADNSGGDLLFDHTNDIFAIRTLAVGDIQLKTSAIAGQPKTRLNIASNGDINLGYEDTGTTAKLIWDASNESLGINSGGRQSIAGLNSRVNGAAIEFGHQNNGGGYYGTLGSYGGNGSSYIGFSTSAELNANTFTTTGILGNIINGDTSGNLRFQQVTNASATGQTPVDRMVLTTSGTLLVGKTSAGSSVVGQELRANGYNVFTRDGDTPLELYRKTSDGSLLNFTKDGTNVGSIGTEGGDLNIGNGDAGLQFVNGTQTVRPFNMTTNARIDAEVDLGMSSTRWKDLYLSGGVIAGPTTASNVGYASNFSVANGDVQLTLERTSGAAGWGGIGGNSANAFHVYNESTQKVLQVSQGDGSIQFPQSTSAGIYLGGTAAANKLDDYESGTWTPTFNSASFTTTGVTSVSGTYVKIGDFVQVSFIVSFTGTSGNFAEGDRANIGGLPFNPVTFNGGGTANASQAYMDNVRMTWQTLPVASTDDIFMVIHSGAGTVGRATGIHGMATYLV